MFLSVIQMDFYKFWSFKHLIANKNKAASHVHEWFVYTL